MLAEKVLSQLMQRTQEMVLVGCGGKLTKPKCMYEVAMKIYGESCIVPVLSKMSKTLEDDRCTPSVRRIKSYLGMVFFYQHFIPNCSSIAKLLFALTAGQKRRGRKTANVKAETFRKLSPDYWTSECDIAFLSLKDSLLNCVVLAHPDFSRPLILSTDASLDGLSAVLSQIPAGESKARPIAFASKTLSSSQKNYPAHRLEFLQQV